MKALSLLVFACGIVAAQVAPTPSVPDLPDDAVIAVFDDGAKFTMADFRNLYAAVPTNQQATMMRDRKGFLDQYALLRKLAQMAEADKLDQKSPNKEALGFSRMVLLGQMKLTDVNMKVIVSEDDVTKFYEANKSQYREVRVRVIYIAFTKALASQKSDGKRLLTEEEAKAKAQKLLADIRAGADFKKLARENSDDAATRDKDGDFGMLKASDSLPDAIKAAVFSLKAGEVTEPIAQPNGFYLLRAEEVTTRPLSEVHGDIYTAMQQEYARKWMETTREAAKVQYPNAQFLSSDKAPAQGK
jgi:peptidyl-prolyl cis-trans isomerase C